MEYSAAHAENRYSTGAEELKSRVNLPFSSSERM
jgi:hypothetical protein